MSEQEQFQGDTYYDEVPSLYHARIVGEAEQVIARKLLRDGMMKPRHCIMPSGKGFNRGYLNETLR